MSPQTARTTRKQRPGPFNFKIVKVKVAKYQHRLRSLDNKVKFTRFYHYEKYSPENLTLHFRFVSRARCKELSMNYLLHDGVKGKKKMFSFICVVRCHCHQRNLLRNHFDM